MQILPSNNSMKYGVASSAPGAAEKIIVKIRSDGKLPSTFLSTRFMIYKNLHETCDLFCLFIDCIISMIESFAMSKLTLSFLVYQFLLKFRGKPGISLFASSSVSLLLSFVE